jgi:hypothetical protein
MAAFLLLLAAYLPALRSARAGLQLDAYNNTALSGAPSTTTVASLGSLALPPALQSAEIRGQLAFPHDGRFGFECSVRARPRRFSGLSAFLLSYVYRFCMVLLYGRAWCLRAL